jgi:hypothetical protein
MPTGSTIEFGHLSPKAKVSVILKHPVNAINWEDTQNVTFQPAGTPENKETFASGLGWFATFRAKFVIFIKIRRRFCNIVSKKG